MRKKIALLLALTMLSAGSASAFAQDGGVQTQASGNINVDISWDEMTFTYFGGHKIWDPKTHTYSTASDMWYSDQKAVYVKNNSETAVKAKLRFDSNIDGLHGNFSQDAFDVSANSTETAYFSISGAGIDGANDNIGSVSVSIETADGEGGL